MLSPTNTTQHIELEMIRSDTCFYYDLMQAVMASKKSSILFLGLTHYLSLFVTETYNYFCANFPDYAQTLGLQHKEAINKSRHKIKLLEEKGFIDLLADTANSDTDFFNRSHTGFFRWRKFFQKDLGLYYYQNNIIQTTHRIDRLSDPFGFGRAIGNYIGRLYRDMFANFHLHNRYIQQNKFTDKSIWYKDVKSSKYLLSIFNGPGSTNVNNAILLLLAELNYCRHVLTDLAPGSPDTLFKLKYIILHHSIISFRKLQDRFYPQGVFTEKSKSFLKSILRDGQFKQKDNHENFRHILVHYAIKDIPENELDKNVKLFGIVEHFFPGYSADDLNDLIDNQIDKVLHHLREWLIYEHK